MLRDASKWSLPAKLDLRLATPAGVEADFHQETLLVAGHGQAARQFSVTPSRWSALLGTFRIALTVDGRTGAAPLEFKVTRSSVTVPAFTDVTSSAGVTTTVPAPNCGSF